MYFDYSPCEVCGAEVQLHSHRTPSLAEPDGTLDERVCTNGDCETHRTE